MIKVFLVFKRNEALLPGRGRWRLYFTTTDADVTEEEIRATADQHGWKVFGFTFDDKTI